MGKGGWVCIHIIFPFPEHCFKNFLSPHWQRRRRQRRQQRRKRSGNYAPLCQKGGKARGEAGIVPPIFCMSVDIAKVWYPRLDPNNDEEPRSHKVTGPDALNDVMTWAWNKHNKWLAD